MEGRIPVIPELAPQERKGRTHTHTLPRNECWSPAHPAALITIIGILALGWWINHTGFQNGKMISIRHWQLVPCVQCDSWMVTATHCFKSSEHSNPRFPPSLPCWLLLTLFYCFLLVIGGLLHNFLPSEHCSMPQNKQKWWRNGSQMIYR